MAKNKKSVYLTESIINEIETEARRQDRSVSWLLQRAWLLSRDKIKKESDALEAMRGDNQ